MLSRRISMTTLFNVKFLIISFILVIISVNLLKWVVSFFPDLNHLLSELIIYGIPAILTTILAFIFEDKIIKKEQINKLELIS